MLHLRSVYLSCIYVYMLIVVIFKQIGCHMSELSESLSYNYCALPLARYACQPEMSLGRLHEEPESNRRTEFQRDKDRIIHSGAFRRLKHKTQVFVYNEGDDYRTRLTHTIEVSQVARALARSLLVNEDLAEAVALAHDLGHTPFAHMGEDHLKVCMEPYGGFEHNDQSLRVLVLLEHKYPRWKGLNLTWETLEGVVKHNGPILEKGQDWRDADLGITCRELQDKLDLRLDTYASMEAQVAAVADDIAYNSHDVQDGLEAGLFTLDDMSEVKVVADVIRDVREEYPDLDRSIFTHEVIRELMGRLIDDVYQTAQANILSVAPKCPEDVRMAGMQMVDFSEGMNLKVNELRKFLFKRMYKHSSVNRIWIKVERIITELFDVFMRDYKVLPEKWQKRIEIAGGDEDKQKRARVVCDYIAGMTDRYAIREHENIFNLYWDMK